MLIYLLKRILLFLPTLLIISVVIFFLSRMAPGDPVIQFIGDPFEAATRGGMDLRRAEMEYAEGARRLGRDKPRFYLQLTGAAWPDTLYRILRKEHRQNLIRLIGQYGNWPEISHYYQTLQKSVAALDAVSPEYSDLWIDLGRNLRQLMVSHDKQRIEHYWKEIGQLKREAPGSALLPALLDEGERAWLAVKTRATPWKRFVPVIYWHGFDNQYHKWFLGLFRGDWGLSLKDSQPVLRKIGQAAFWTLLINIPALLIALGVAIPVGVWMARNAGRKRSGLTGLFLYFLYSLPNFWVATLLILFFTSPEYGEWLDIFPSVGLSSLPDSAPFWSRFLDTAAHLILPVACVVYPSLAFIAQQVKGGMLDNLRKEFVKTARAKGVREKVVLWRHAFRNALFPLITILGSAFASVLSGAVVIEFVFNIPGMGRLVYDAILDNDWPVIFGVVQLGAFLTILGYLIADFLYAAADPRVKFTKKAS